MTCRTQEYEQLLDAHPTGLGLVQAVEILPLSSEQLDSAFVELAQRDTNWETFLSQRDLTAYKRVRHLLSNPLFLNLAVVGHLSPDELLDSTTTEQDLQDLVLESYLDSTLADQRPYEPQDARHHLSWIARFLHGDEISPFGLKTSDYTVFDLADLTPPDPPRRYGLFGGLGFGLLPGLVYGLSFAQGLGVIHGLSFERGLGQYFLGQVIGLVTVAILLLVFVLVFGLIFALVFAMVFALVWGTFKRSAVSSRLTLVWPSTRRQLLDFLRRAGRGLGLGLVVGLVMGLIFGLSDVLVAALGVELGGSLVTWLVSGLFLGLFLGLFFGLVMGLGYGLLETRSVLITSRTPKEARSRSLIAALTWLASGLGLGLVVDLVDGLLLGQVFDLGLGLSFGLGFGLVMGLRNGGWFVVLQKVAHRRLARDGNLPSRLYDFLDWGVDTQVFRRVGGGVRFRHNLIQQHLASTSADAGK